MSASAGLAFATHLLDFRGRCNRKGLLIIAGFLLAAEILSVCTAIGFALPPGHRVLIALKLLFMWTAFTAGAKRLHDLGRSAWSMLWFMAGITVWSALLAFAALMIAGDAVLEPSSPWYWGIVIGTMLPVFAATLWLHLAPGEDQRNRHGPVPDGLGFSRPPIAAAARPAFSTAA